jgi:hypothetical protein
VARDDDAVGETVKAKISFVVGDYPRKTHKVERGESLWGVVGVRFGSWRQLLEIPARRGWSSASVLGGRPMYLRRDPLGAHPLARGNSEEGLRQLGWSRGP